MTLHKEIIFSKRHIDTLRKHARKNAPNESCAILFGKNNNGTLTTMEVFLAKNIEQSPVSFTISNDELIQAYGEAEKKNFEVIGIFHSHPESAAYPSSTDQKYMEINPIPWVIFSNINDEFRGYILESSVIPVVVRIV